MAVRVVRGTKPRLLSEQEVYEEAARGSGPATAASVEPKGSPEPLTVEQLKQNLATNDRWALRGLLAVYAYQTSQEKVQGATVELNGVGFGGADGVFLSSLAEQAQAHKALTPKQLNWLRKLMPKYAGQLLKIVAMKAKESA